jgi:hypothetical protein
MKTADPAAAIRQTVDHYIAPGRAPFRRRALEIGQSRIRNVESEVEVAIGLMEIDHVDPFRSSLIAFEFLSPAGRTTQRYRICFQRLPVPNESQTPRGFFDDHAISHGIAGQGIDVQVSVGSDPRRPQAKQEQEDQKYLQAYSSGRRARGSRSFVVAVLGAVTNGPPSSGALSENATSGILLGKPSSGNSFRRGK